MMWWYFKCWWETYLTFQVERTLIQKIKLSIVKTLFRPDTISTFFSGRNVYNHAKSRQWGKKGRKWENCALKNVFFSRKERILAFKHISCACCLPPDKWINSNHIQGYCCLHCTSPLCLFARYTINIFFGRTLPMITYILHRRNSEQNPILKTAFKNTVLLPETEYTCCPKQNRKHKHWNCYKATSWFPLKMKDGVSLKMR